VTSGYNYCAAAGCHERMECIVEAVEPSSVHPTSIGSQQHIRKPCHGDNDDKGAGNSDLMLSLFCCAYSCLSWRSCPAAPSGIPIKTSKAEALRAARDLFQQGTTATTPLPTPNPHTYPLGPWRTLCLVLKHIMCAIQCIGQAQYRHYPALVTHSKVRGEGLGLYSEVD
jgi:hypothetical protein